MEYLSIQEQQSGGGPNNVHASAGPPQLPPQVRRLRSCDYPRPQG